MNQWYFDGSRTDDGIKFCFYTNNTYQSLDTDLDNMVTTQYHLSLRDNNEFAPESHVTFFQYIRPRIIGAAYSLQGETIKLHYFPNTGTFSFNTTHEVFSDITRTMVDIWFNKNINYVNC